MSNLKTDKNLDKHLKPVKSDVENTSLQLATEGNGAKVTGDLTVTGTVNIKTEGTLQTNKLQSNSNGESYVGLSNDIDLVANTDIQISPGRTVYLGDSAQQGYIYVKKPMRIEEQASADNDIAGHGQLWVKSDAPNNLYFTDDTGQDVQITNDGSLAAGGGGGTSRWSHSWGGYKTSNSSSTTYYFQYYPNNNVWNNSESSPTSISYFDMYAAEWIAPADGTLTKIDVFVRGGSDDCQFYVFKGTPSSANSSLSLTQIGASGACGITTSSKTFYKSAAISSSNTFSAGDGLYIMMKKESHSISTHFYFSGTISGEYS